MKLVSWICLTPMILFLTYIALALLWVMLTHWVGLLVIYLIACLFAANRLLD